MKKALFTAVCLIFFSGCTAVEYYPVYKQVSVPVICSVDIPKRPEYTSNLMQDNLNILMYTESLEAALKSCINQ